MPISKGDELSSPFSYKEWDPEGSHNTTIAQARSKSSFFAFCLQ